MKCMVRVHSVFFFKRKHQTLRNWLHYFAFLPAKPHFAGRTYLFFFFLLYALVQQADSISWAQTGPVDRLVERTQKAPILYSSVSESTAQEQLSSCLSLLMKCTLELHLASCICLLLFQFGQNKLMDILSILSLIRLRNSSSAS